jgi:glycosyltransferase involved in cell wall biosynthesis
MHRLRAWDAMSACRPDAIASNSAYIAARIRHAWGRAATVIHPPVDTAAFVPGAEPGGGYYVTASRLVGYKRVGLIAEAFAAMPPRQLRIIGDGPDMRHVKAIAGRAQNIDILGHLPRSQLIENLQSARAFVFAAEEDFGIAPVEAMACGIPAIAYARGGAAESVLDGSTGLLFTEQTAAAIARAVEAFERMPAPSAQACRQRALEFSPELFRARFQEFVAGHVG